MPTPASDQPAAVPFASQVRGPSPAASAAPRIAYLESIRGLAAVQVLLLHFISAFIPELVASAPSSSLAASIHLSPLYFLYDGYSAVYVFFCLSGYVLTRSFERRCAAPPVQILARAVRLGLPAMAATVFAASLMLMLGRPNVEAGQLLSNAWLSRQWEIDLSVWSVVRDGIINALALGYRDMPGLALLAPWQQPVNQSLVAPLWTLSIEFYGSIAIMALCWCGRRSRRLWWTAVVLGTLFTIRSAYFCFLIGHLLAATRHAERPVSGRRLPAMALVVCGLSCCVLTDVWQPEWLIRLCASPTPWLFPGQFPQMQQKAYGAILILAGVMDLQSCRDCLAKPWIVRQSRTSFPLYLVHWPVMCGPASLALLHLNAIAGLPIAQAGAVAIGLAASAAASVVFATVDRHAVNLSSRLRRRAAMTAAAAQRPAGAAGYLRIQSSR